MQVLTFVPDAMLLTSLAMLAPSYQPFHAHPRPAVSVVDALVRSHAPPRMILRAQATELRACGARLCANSAAVQRRRTDHNRRHSKNNRRTKLLWSDVLEMRAGNETPLEVQRRLAGYGVHVTQSTIGAILRGESWQEPPR